MKNEQSAETKLHKDAKKQHDQDGQEREHVRSSNRRKEERTSSI